MRDLTYSSHLTWQGSTAAGYRAYSRAHGATAPPASQPIALSADPHFRGDADRINPEQLLLMAASSCQLLSFLSLAARSGVDVVRYSDDASAVMPFGASPRRITAIELRPEVAVAHGTDVHLVERLMEQAHDECYIASSLNAAITVEPSVTTMPVAGGEA